MNRMGLFFTKDLDYLTPETAVQIKNMSVLRQLLLIKNVISKYWYCKNSAEGHTLYEHTGPNNLLLENIIFLTKIIKQENCISGVLCLTHKSKLFTYNFNSRNNFLDEVKLAIVSSLPIAYVALTSQQVLDLLYKTIVENRNHLKITISSSYDSTKSVMTKEELLCDNSRLLMQRGGFWISSKVNPNLSRSINWAILHRHLSAILSDDFIVESWKDQMLQISEKVITSLADDQHDTTKCSKRNTRTFQQQRLGSINAVK